MNEIEQIVSDWKANLITEDDAFDKGLSVCVEHMGICKDDLHF